MRWGALVLGACAIAGGCDAPVTEQRAQAIAADYARENLSRIIELEGKVAELERKQGAAEREINSVAEAHESLRGTFNKNVDSENAARARAMTARGDCGREWVTYPDGGQVLKNIQCTVKDLRPPS